MFTVAWAYFQPHSSCVAWGEGEVWNQLPQNPERRVQLKLSSYRPPRHQHALNKHRLALFKHWITSPLCHWLAPNKSGSLSAGRPTCGMRYSSRRSDWSGGNAIWPIFSRGGLTGAEERSKGGLVSRWRPEELVFLPAVQVNRLTLPEPANKRENWQMGTLTTQQVQNRVFTMTIQVPSQWTNDR